MAARQGGSASGLCGPENRYQGNAIPCYMGDNSLFGAAEESGLKWWKLACIQRHRKNRRPDFGTKLMKFPVFFPVSREFGLESGSLETPSTAIKSL
jgi:hypothetical protein